MLTTRGLSRLTAVSCILFLYGVVFELGPSIFALVLMRAEFAPGAHTHAHSGTKHTCVAQTRVLTHARRAPAHLQTHVCASASARVHERASTRMQARASARACECVIARAHGRACVSVCLCASGCERVFMGVCAHVCTCV